MLQVADIVSSSEHAEVTDTAVVLTAHGEQLVVRIPEAMVAAMASRCACCAARLAAAPRRSRRLKSSVCHGSSARRTRLAVGVWSGDAGVAAPGS